MKKENIQFENSAGEKLAGILDLPTSTPRAYALFAHCFTCSKNIRAATIISRALIEAGFAVLRFDFTGLGQSEGEFADSNFSSNVEDLIAAANYLEDNYEAPSILIGHSLGGTAVLQAAHSIPSAMAVASIGAPSNPAHVAHLFSDKRKELEKTGSAEVNLGGRPFKIKQQFLQDLEQQTMPESLGTLRKAVLILHSPLDETVEIENASELFLAAKHPKSFVSLDNANHLLTREEDARYAGEVIQTWAARFLPALDEEASVGEGVVVARTEAGGFFTSIQAGPHHLVADEPETVGGSNLGPTPYGLLSAALGACTTMTLQMYAARKKLDLREVSVEVTHAKVHVDDCVDCEIRSAKVDEFQKVIQLEGNLSDEERQQLLEIADRCPVHKTLHSEVQVKTQLADSTLS
jgi:putative redox protein